MGSSVRAAALLVAACASAPPRGAQLVPRLVEQTSGVSADLRGVVAVDDLIVWASGTGGTWLRSEDGGRSWKSGTVPGADRVDFRSLAAFDARRAIVLGAGSPARMFRTEDGGASWREIYRNDAPEIFFDALRFADDSRGYALADPIAGRFVLLETVDAGASWYELPGPEAQAGEGAFAASNSCLEVRGDRLWFATGGATARVFRSIDRGRTWTVAAAPVASGSPSQGVFSLAFASLDHGALVGGDYKAPGEPGAFATTGDGGLTWTRGAPPPGYLSSAVFFGPDRVVATGTAATVTDLLGGGWVTIGPGLNAVSVSGQAGWGVGPKGRVARFITPRTGGP